VEFVQPINRALYEAGEYGECERCQHAFESVVSCNLWLVQTVVAGDGWSEVAIPCIKESPVVAGFVLIGSLLTIDLGMLNLILTVIVTAAREAHEADEARKINDRATEFDKAKHQLLKVCAELDEDGSGELTLEELYHGFEESDAFADTMAVMDLRREDLQVVFKILDEDGSGSLSYKEFVEQLHRMKSQDTQTMLLFIKGYVNELRINVAEQLSLVKEELVGKTGEVHRIFQKLVGEKVVEAASASIRADEDKKMQMELSGHEASENSRIEVKEEPEIGGVLGELGGEIARLRAQLDQDLRSISARLAEPQRSPRAPPRPVEAPPVQRWGFCSSGNMVPGSSVTVNARGFSSPAFGSHPSSPITGDPSRHNGTGIQSISST